jgi:hypothetical protein
MIDDDSALAANFDFMFAIVLVMGVVTMAILIMPNLSHEDRSWRNEQYMTGVRASDNLVRDEGEAGWVANWQTSDYANVTKIGFVNDSEIPKVLNKTKIDVLMVNYTDDVTNLTWWEFPNSAFNDSNPEHVNASRTLGLEGYKFYMQLHPVGLDNFSSIPLEMNLTNVSKIYDTVSVDRYVYIKNDSCKGGFTCYYNKTVHYRLNLWVW